jgi:glyoxylase-like metal-dependent hydrolase (beta-lactamase superfamily II)
MEVLTTEDTYKLYAICYSHVERYAGENFIRGDVSKDAMPLAYFIWAIVGEHHTIIVDTGFNERTARERNRRFIDHPADSLKAINIFPEDVQDVIITHMDYDHAGNHDLFPRARFHVQDREMAYCTGRLMCHPFMRIAIDGGVVASMVQRVFEDRVQFHDGTEEIVPGVTVHLVGGHTMGIQVVRVRTNRGWVVLASDASHFYANIEQNRPFPIAYSIAEMLEGFAIVRRLASSPQHIIPGHDPLVLRRYPAAQAGLENVVVRLDLPPIEV